MVCEFVESRFLHNAGLVALALTHLDIYTHLDNVVKFIGPEKIVNGQTRWETDSLDYMYVICLFGKLKIHLHVRKSDHPAIVIREDSGHPAVCGGKNLWNVWVWILGWKSGITTEWWMAREAGDRVVIQVGYVGI